MHKKRHNKSKPTSMPTKPRNKRLIHVFSMYAAVVMAVALFSLYLQHKKIQTNCNEATHHIVCYGLNACMHLFNIITTTIKSGILALLSCLFVHLCILFVQKIRKYYVMTHFYITKVGEDTHVMFFCIRVSKNRLSRWFLQSFIEQNYLLE